MAEINPVLMFIILITLLGLSAFFSGSENKKIDALLRSFKARKLHQAVVLDQQGSVSGLITLEDILEELVGSTQDEHDRD